MKAHTSTGARFVGQFSQLANDQVQFKLIKGGKSLHGGLDIQLGKC